MNLENRTQVEHDIEETLGRVRRAPHALTGAFPYNHTLRKAGSLGARIAHTGSR
jgi:hypothetical protein